MSLLSNNATFTILSVQHPSPLSSGTLHPHSVPAPATSLLLGSSPTSAIIRRHWQEPSVQASPSQPDLIGLRMGMDLLARPIRTLP